MDSGHPPPFTLSHRKGGCLMFIEKRKVGEIKAKRNKSEIRENQ